MGEEMHFARHIQGPVQKKEDYATPVLPQRPHIFPQMLVRSLHLHALRDLKSALQTPKKVL